MQLLRGLSLQAQVSLVLVGVLLPTFIIVTVAENQLTLPILKDEVRQIGVNSGKAIAARVESGRLLSLASPSSPIENILQELLFNQPDVVRADVLAKDHVTGAIKMIASNVEDEPGEPLPQVSWMDTVSSEYRTDEAGYGQWEIYVPIDHGGRDLRGPRRLQGVVHIVVSTSLVTRITNTLWKTTAAAGALSGMILFAALSYFLRKTITNERLLRLAESHNLRLTAQLHEAQRELMMTEKLAVMGQLTASFAHEIGTPLNAIGGHLQLLREDEHHRSEGRLEIIQGQLDKIEAIVKGFLQSTAKPTSQKQLVDPNRLVDKTLGIVTPRVESLGIQVRRVMNHEMGPVRIVPLDLEQVLLNLFNNSLDSIQAKLKGRTGGRAMRLDVMTEMVKLEGKDWAQLSVYDTGEGIRKVDLKKVWKPFFTTKRPGEGTGLGLTICQELVQKYGGTLAIDSKEGAWTRVMVRLPYHVQV
jgi:signal transduction histidine kinase